MMMKITMENNRKSATKLLLIQWSRFQNICMRLEGSTLFTGVNGSGKSTILDAMTYLLTGNTQFNKAAKDKDRTVVAYVRGDTKSNGSTRYLRNGEVVSYIAMEFWSPVDNSNIVIGVCIESPDETSYKSNWFICRNAKLEDINFSQRDNKILKITPKNELTVNGKRLKTGDFFGRDKGVEQVLRALGLRCDAGKYRSKLMKMMAFNPENNIDQFIQECVLEPGKVDSLKELREQKNQFERIKGEYENLRKSKLQLEIVERKSIEYEEKLRNLQMHELMLCYQQLREKEEKEKEIKIQREKIVHKKEILEKQKEELEKRQSDAIERCRIAENNDAFKGIQDSVKELEHQIELSKRDLKAYQRELSTVKNVQVQLTNLLRWIGQFIEVTEEDKRYLCNLAEKEYNEQKKVDIFLEFVAKVKEQNNVFENEEVHSKDLILQLKLEIEEIKNKIKKLEANRMVLPKKVEEAKRILKQELEKKGIKTDVRVFAELVQEIKDAEWRAAIETFLGAKRFYIIVEGIYCYDAMEILKEKSIHGVNVVITDKLPDTKIVQGSAADILMIPNIYARRYANYLLNGIHLCNSLKELHEYPKGGLMKNGMLSKSYSVSYMDMKNTEYCLGQDSIKYQLQQALGEKKEKSDELNEIQNSLNKIKRYRQEIGKIDWNIQNYDFQVAKQVHENLSRQNQLKQDIKKLQNTPDFIAVLQEQEDAKRECNDAMKAVKDIYEKNGSYKKELENQEQLLKTLSGEIYQLKQNYSEQCALHLELKRPMLEKYEKIIVGKHNTWQAITNGTVKNMKSDVENCIRDLENAQIEYCKLATIDTNKRGKSYIPFYRQEYRNIANIKIEEAHSKLEAQGKKLESAFMNDFVAEINETIREAKKEIDVINRELKQIPFGNDTYKFIMKEKADRNVFFRICRKLENYMNSPEFYMKSGRDDEEMEHDIQEFMSMILEEEDETEYTDYRKYFVYDMEIISKQGDNEIIADLSKKQGSASNGEKQTPYFIILAASLIQYYPKNVCCARLAFIDEAFSALSRERIEQMVKYFEENNFQVFYAAPPEKISSIGTFIESTVSLVMTGRYTHAIEGLVRK